MESMRTWRPPASEQELQRDNSPYGRLFALQLLLDQTFTNISQVQHELPEINRQVTGVFDTQYYSDGAALGDAELEPINLIGRTYGVEAKRLTTGQLALSLMIRASGDFDYIPELAVNLPEDTLVAAPISRIRQINYIDC